MPPAAAQSKPLPAPTEGWDTRESIADMPSKRAIVMDNWFPETEKVTLRRGSAVHASGMSGAVETLIDYVALSGAGTLFAANGGNIYNVTAAGAVGAAVSSGHSNNRWQYVHMATAAGQFIRLFNGADTPLLYNGSTWATTAITGPTVTNLIWCNAHQKRLWVGETSSLSAWYLPVNTVSGAATEFPLGGVFRLGGYIMAMATWTRDAGDGMDDVAVFVTSEGECAVYQGTDPAAAATWSLVGNFRIGKPIGRRCFISAGADLILVTQDGFVPLSAILSMDRSQAERVALSKQIAKAVNSEVRAHGTLFGWQPIVYPKGQQLIFNIPQSATVSHQFAFNTITGAPARFLGMDATCFALLDDNLYYGGVDGRVYQADTGASDNPAGVLTTIVGDVSQAFHYFGSPGRNKAFKSVEPILEANGTPNVSVNLNTDFRTNSITSLPSPSASAETSAEWGTGEWGSGLWGSGSQIYSGWRGVRGRGRAAAMRIRVSSTTVRPSWLATNFLYIPGGQNG
jgi:hypothetical protein